MSNKTKTIDITPTWSATMDILVLMLESGDDESKALARQELRDFGKQLDELKQQEVSNGDSQ